MKLRIQGNSIRFRLTQTEVANLGKGNSCSASSGFPGGAMLTYQIIPSKELKATFNSNVLSIELPRATVTAWAQTEQVSIKGCLKLENEDILSILVEKDFKCLTERSEDESDMFPNPKESH